MNTDKSLFQERLRYLRESRGLKQKNLAEGLNYSIGTISSWERGKNEPSLADIKRIAEYFEIPSGWLAFGENPDFEAQSWANTIRSMPEDQQDSILRLIETMTGINLPRPGSTIQNVNPIETKPYVFDLELNKDDVEALARLLDTVAHPKDATLAEDDLTHPLSHSTSVLRKLLAHYTQQYDSEIDVPSNESENIRESNH